MAQIVKKNNDLSKKYQHYKRLATLGFIISAACFIGFALNMGKFTFGLNAPLMLGFGGGALFGGFMQQKAKIYKTGVEGEAATAQIISTLPEQYCGFQNIKVTFEGKTSELDMVVVGPTGVFIIETKNMGGTIVGNAENPQWVQKKVGQEGTPYSRNFYNPIKQVGTHVYRLAHHLRNNGFNIHVEPMVYFSNPDAVVQVFGNGKTPVFSAIGNGTSDICNYILNRPTVISSDDLLKIAMLLDGRSAAATAAVYDLDSVVSNAKTAQRPAAPAKQSPVQTTASAPVAPTRPVAPVQSGATAFCKYCGKPVATSAVFCPACGNKLH